MKEINEEELKDVTGGLNREECDRSIAYLRAEIDHVNEEIESEKRRQSDLRGLMGPTGVEYRPDPLNDSNMRRNVYLSQLGEKLSAISQACAEVS